MQLQLRWKRKWATWLDESSKRAAVEIIAAIGAYAPAEARIAMSNMAMTKVEIWMMDDMPKMIRERMDAVARDVFYDSWGDFKWDKTTKPQWKDRWTTSLDESSKRAAVEIIAAMGADAPADAQIWMIDRMPGTIREHMEATARQILFDMRKDIEREEILEEHGLGDGVMEWIEELPRRIRRLAFMRAYEQPGGEE